MDAEESTRRGVDVYDTLHEPQWNSAMKAEESGRAALGRSQPPCRNGARP